MSHVVVDFGRGGPEDDHQLKRRRFNPRSFVFNNKLVLAGACVVLTALLGLVSLSVTNTNPNPAASVLVADHTAQGTTAGEQHPPTQLQRPQAEGEELGGQRRNEEDNEQDNNQDEGASAEAEAEAEVEAGEGDDDFGDEDDDFAEEGDDDNGDHEEGDEGDEDQEEGDEGDEEQEKDWGDGEQDNGDARDGPDEKAQPPAPAHRTHASAREPLTQATVLTPRQTAVREAFRWAWDAYERDAWGKDELRPVAKTGEVSFRLGLTLVDGLDTLYVMGDMERFNRGVEWVRTSLTFQRAQPLNVFETTIRVLGGLLSAHALSGEGVLLEKASELAHGLSGAFQAGNGFVPHSDVSLTTRRGSLGMGKVSVSEATTVQLEFKTLAHLNPGKDAHYFDWMEKCSDAVDSMREALPAHTKGLVPMFIDLGRQRFDAGSTLTLGARGDSYYEYLLKQWLLTGKTQRKHLDRYLEAVRHVRANLIATTKGDQRYVYVGELLGGRNFSPKMDHLVCFLPGVLALGTMEGAVEGQEAEEHLQLAKDLMRTCVAMYTSTATGLAPEITHFDMPAHAPKELFVKPADAHNILRPETVESLMYLYRATGHAQYQEWGWGIFQSFEKHSRVATGGYSGLKDVTRVGSVRMDKMESFFLAETLKYLFLLFDDAKTLLPLDKFVFNTEAHPLPVFQHAV